MDMMFISMLIIMQFNANVNMSNTTMSAFKQYNSPQQTVQQLTEPSKEVIIHEYKSSPDPLLYCILFAQLALLLATFAIVLFK
jgi:hypothetical protein